VRARVKSASNVDRSRGAPLQHAVHENGGAQLRRLCESHHAAVPKRRVSCRHAAIDRVADLASGTEANLQLPLKGLAGNAEAHITQERILGGLTVFTASAVTTRACRRNATRTSSRNAPRTSRRASTS